MREAFVLILHTQVTQTVGRLPYHPKSEKSMSNPLNHKWVIQSSDGVMDICVPQCCDEWANISIGYIDDYKRNQYKNNSMFRKVYLPSFEIDKDGGKSFGEMDFSIYEKYLHANKVEINALVEKLNAAAS